MPPFTKNYPDNPEVRRRSQKCFVDRATNDVILRLHETDIVRVRPNGDVILSTGGWATHKTLRSMNDALELFDMWVESTSGNLPRGDWVVYDADGQPFPYENNKINHSVTIPGRGDDCRMRCQWLAEGYKVPYIPTPAPQPTAARIVSAPAPPFTAAAAAAAAAAAPRPAAAAAPRAAPTAAPIAAAPAASRRPTTPGPIAGQPGGTGSWANIARSGVSPPQTALVGGHPARVTGPGVVTTATAAAPPAAAATVAAPPAAASPGSSLRALDVARSKMQAAAGAPARPVTEQIEQHMKQLGIHADELEDDAHLCVVCMEHPRSVVLVPCGHMALCSVCCEKIIVKDGKACPMCCQAVDYHVEVDG